MTNKEQQVYDYIHDTFIENGVFLDTNKDIREVISINDRTLYRILKSLEQNNLISRNTVSVGNFGKQRSIQIL
tara:strand:+ start:181 stop:399 length:219 start_codon:yes stop_codon:yes gene_type:complete